MNTIRAAVASLGALLLLGGYAASQWAVFRGEQVEYAARIDQPATQNAALALFLLALGLSFWPDSMARSVSREEP